MFKSLFRNVIIIHNLSTDGLCYYSTTLIHIFHLHFAVRCALDDNNTVDILLQKTIVINIR